MSRVSQLSGKGPLSGNHVSHSNHKTKRKFYPNLQRKKFFLTTENRWVTLKLTAREIRTITKKGLAEYLREQEARGNKIKV